MPATGPQPESLLLDGSPGRRPPTPLLTRPVDTIRVEGAVRNAEGHYMITGRLKEWVRRGGLTIIPVELEEILIKHPLVEKVAIVGMPDPRLGERTCAYVKPAQGRTITLDEVIFKIFTDAELATFKMPECLELLGEIPVTQHDKVDKKLLRERITDRLKAEGVL